MATTTPRIGRNPIPRSRWKWNCEIKDILREFEDADGIPEGDVRRVGLEISSRLLELEKAGGPVFDERELLVVADDADELDGILDTLYDWADDNNVWAGL